MKKNCWDVKNCGRFPSGPKVQELGVCPVTTDSTYHGKNEGEKAGRFCWRIAGTFCGGKIQGTFAEKKLSCLNCEFLKMVKAEEGPNFHIE